MNDIFHSSFLNKWCWIELIGFDNTSADYGIGSFIKRTGFIPDGISLLLYWTGFVFNHVGMKEELPLSICEASYGGHKYCPERQRQDWTNLQLKALISKLHSLNIKVFLSYFNMYSYYDDDAKLNICEYFNSKEYLMETNRAKNRGALAMLKKQRDGIWFEDVLQEKTITTLCDYDFDGIQIADGISSPRMSLQEADFTPEMLSQFYDYTGLSLPDGEQDEAKWIWREKRYEWICFHTTRWESFYKKYVERLQAVGKKGIFNSAWTRDPFEAIYRYGVDYRKVAATGIDGCMVEDVSPGLAILSSRDNLYLMNDGQRRRVHYDFLTALMLNRAAMPKLIITPLSSIHDTMEQWGVLEHMPTSMTRNVMSNLNTYIVNEDGIRPVTDGAFFCLSDSLSESDWNFIRKNWEIGFTASAKSTAGVTLVWSDRRLDSEILEFCESRRLPTHKIVSELLYGGAPISTVIRVESLDNARGAILVTNFDLMPEDEQRCVLNYKHGNVLAIGKSGCLSSRFSEVVCEENNFGSISLELYDGCTETEYIINDKDCDFDPKTSMEPLEAIWTHPLTFSPVKDEFWQRCSDKIIEISNAPVIHTAINSKDENSCKVCKYICVYTGENSCKIIITNDDYYYNHPKIELKQKIKDIKCLTKYYGYKVQHGDDWFECRVPGRGAEAFEITFEI